MYTTQDHIIYKLDAAVMVPHRCFVIMPVQTYVQYVHTCMYIHTIGHDLGQECQTLHHVQYNTIDSGLDEWRPIGHHDHTQVEHIRQVSHH